MKKWNLFVCGDFEDGPFALNISSPTVTTSELKSSVAQKLKVPEKEISLYFGEMLLPARKLLTDIEGLRGGAGVVVTAKPLRITVQRYDSDVDIRLMIPRLEAPRWKTEWLFDFILFKTGMPDRSDGKYLFAVEGTVLKEERKLSSYSFLEDDFTVSVSFLQTLKCQNIELYFEIPSHRLIYIPPSAAALSKELTYGRSDYQHHDHHQIHFYDTGQEQQLTFSLDRWRLTVQQINGTKNVIELAKRHLTSVYELRQEISCEENIRLTVGTTILEDWDEEGKLMLLCNYPEVHDEATLYQINLTGAMHIKYKFWGDGAKEIHDDLQLKNPSSKIICPHIDHVYIEDPHHFSMKRLMKVFRNLGLERGNNIIYVNGRQVSQKSEICSHEKKQRKKTRKPALVDSEDPISSFDSIYDGCTVHAHHLRLTY